LAIKKICGSPRSGLRGVRDAARPVPFRRSPAGGNENKRRRFERTAVHGGSKWGQVRPVRPSVIVNGMLWFAMQEAASTVAEIILPALIGDVAVN